MSKKTEGTPAQYSFKKFTPGTDDVVSRQVRVSHEHPPEPPKQTFVREEMVDGQKVIQYKTVDGFTTDKAKADWFEQDSYVGWTIDQTRPKVDGFPEWRTASGEITEDVNEAGFFPVEDLPMLRNLGWFQFGQPQDITVKGTDDVTEYKTVNGVTQDKSMADWFEQDSFVDWTVLDTKPAVADKVEWLTENGIATTAVNKAGWFPEAELGSLNDQGWQKYGQTRNFTKTEGTENVTKYKTNLGTTLDKAEADWYNAEEAHPDWDVADTRKTTKPAVPGPIEWRKADGSATQNEADAALFPVAKLPEFAADGWLPYGDVESIEVTKGTPGVTVYLTATGTTENKDEAAWYTNPGDYPEWTIVETKPARKSHFEWLAQDGKTATENVDEAGFFPVKDLEKLRGLGWFQFGDPKDIDIEKGTPDKVLYLVVKKNGSQTDTTNEAKASWVDPKKVKVGSQWVVFDTKPSEVTPKQKGYVEYYLPGGEPTKKLTDKNWTKESPEGWELVDKKFVETKPAVAPVTTEKTVVVKKAWDEKVKVPATTCAVSAPPSPGKDDADGSTPAPTDPGSNTPSTDVTPSSNATPGEDVAPSSGTTTSPSTTDTGDQNSFEDPDEDTTGPVAETDAGTSAINWLVFPLIAAAIALIFAIAVGVQHLLRTRPVAGGAFIGEEPQDDPFPGSDSEDTTVRFDPEDRGDGV